MERAERFGRPGARGAARRRWRPPLHTPRAVPGWVAQGAAAVARHVGRLGVVRVRTPRMRGSLDRQPLVRGERHRAGPHRPVRGPSDDAFPTASAATRERVIP